MISVYWPYKRVPSWLGTVKAFRNELPVAVSAIHKGFGLTVKVNGEYYVWAAAVTFMNISGEDISVEVKGGGRGVNLYSQFLPWLKAIQCAVQVGRL